MMQVEITHREMAMIRAALRAVTRSGGGSETWSLYLKLAKEGLPFDEKEVEMNLVRQYSEACIDEAVEAGVVTRHAF